MLEVLGVGSTSTCHKCKCRATNLPYACKIIDKQHIDDKFQGMMEQFHVEIEALRNLQHPSIIRLYDVYITEEKIFIIMELMEGGELFDYVVQKGTLTEEEASRIVKSVTSAMVYMHSKNVRLDVIVYRCSGGMMMFRIHSQLYSSQTPPLFRLFIAT